VIEPDDKAVVVRRTSPPPVRVPPQAVAANVVPELARAAAATWWRAMTWSVETSLAATSAVLKKASSGQAPAAALTGLAAEARGAAWRALGLGEQIGQRGVAQTVAPADVTVQDLQERGSELLRRSNDVRVVEATHPAFARILAEITPDEARILRLLYVNGPQPSVDVRTNRPLGIGSQLVADGLNMIAEHAGCRDVERVHPYLTNLFRLGLIDFSKEQVTNPQRYQLVEAQPKVTEALKRAGRWPRIVHRSIALNSFGAEFCRTCLPLSSPPVTPGVDSGPAAPFQP
jgi:abortive infection alpha-like protein